MTWPPAAYRGQRFRLYVGDAAQVLAELPAASIDVACTSPPFYGLRDYGAGPEELGHEPGPQQYVERLLAVLAQVRRALKPTGSLWVEVGDTYSHPGGAGGGDLRPGHKQPNLPVYRQPQHAYPPKTLLAVPWRLAAAMVDAGWFLRGVVAWHKPNRLPRPARDRLLPSWTPLLWATVSPDYYFALPPPRRPPTPAALWDGHEHPSPRPVCLEPDVWTVPTGGGDGGHQAPWPREIPARCIRLTCPPGGVVLDPFAGSGTTLLAALEAGCEAVGIELRPDYAQAAAARLAALEAQARLWGYIGTGTQSEQTPVMTGFDAVPNECHPGTEGLEGTGMPIGTAWHSK